MIEFEVTILFHLTPPSLNCVALSRNIVISA